jgi:sortase (surface protein transpeptidase)
VTSESRKGIRGRLGRQWIWWGVAAVALAVGVTALVTTFPRSDPRSVVLSQTATPATPAVAVTATANSKVTIPSVGHSRPLVLIIPALGIRTKVGTLGLQPDHEVMVPTNTHTVGWYRDGPTPGQVGSAVILGHVDSYLGPGTFFYLKNLKAGDPITLDLANGAVTHFVVTKVVQYAKTSFPDRLVYGSHGIRALQLVTCGGTFDHATGHYESNVVVFSHLVSATKPKK